MTNQSFQQIRGAVKPPSERCSDHCDFCGSAAQVSLAYETDQPETLACVPCATERDVEIGSLYIGKDEFGVDQWESIDQLADELNLAGVAHV